MRPRSPAWERYHAELAAAMGALGLGNLYLARLRECRPVSAEKRGVIKEIVRFECPGGWLVLDTELPAVLEMELDGERYVLDLESFTLVPAGEAGQRGTGPRRG